MKVYVIQKGEYSDRHIIGVTVDENLAKDIAKIASGQGRYYDTSIEEYDTDQFTNNRFRFRVMEYYGDWIAEYDDYGIYSQYSDNTRIFDMDYIIYAENTDVAIKIAQDMEAEYQAEQNGVKL